MNKHGFSQILVDWKALDARGTLNKLVLIKCFSAALHTTCLIHTHTSGILWHADLSSQELNHQYSNYSSWHPGLPSPLQPHYMLRNEWCCNSDWRTSYIKHNNQNFTQQDTKKNDIETPEIHRNMQKPWNHEWVTSDDCMLSIQSTNGKMWFQHFGVQSDTVKNIIIFTQIP